MTDKNKGAGSDEPGFFFKFGTCVIVLILLGMVLGPVLISVLLFILLLLWWFIQGTILVTILGILWMGITGIYKIINRSSGSPKG